MTMSLELGIELHRSLRRGFVFSFLIPFLHLLDLDYGFGPHIEDKI